MDATSWLQDWFKERNPAVELAPDVSYIEAGAIDSFGMIELIEGVEAEFAIRFSEQDFQDQSLFTLAGLAAAVAAKQEG